MVKKKFVMFVNISWEIKIGKYYIICNQEWSYRSQERYIWNNSTNISNSTQQWLGVLDAKRFFTDFKEEITKIITEKSNLKIVDKKVSRCIDICTLFDSLFSLSRTSCGEMNDEKLKQLKEIIKLSMMKWRNLRMAIQMIKVHGVEDHLFDQIKHYNGIGCFV